LGAPLPEYAHVPMILGANGERVSKRHGAVSVTQYRDDGYLPEALVNYLARLGWSHGDEEIFSRDQLIEWFDLTSISRSPAKFNPEKLHWLNQQYLKKTDNTRLSKLVIPFLEQDYCKTDNGPDLNAVVNLLKERVNTIEELADAAVFFFRPLEPTEELKTQFFTADNKPVLLDLMNQLTQLTDWNKDAIQQTIKATVKAHGVKFPMVAMPLRVMVTGETHTPSIDAVLELLGREETLKRMNTQMDQFPNP